MYDATTHNAINNIVYDENGNVDFIEECTYTDNRMSSKKTTWSDGTYVIDEYDIVTGLCTKWTHYDANGLKLYTTVFTNGEITETIYYDSEGNIIP